MASKIKITTADFALLRVFCENPQRVPSRDQLVTLAGNEVRLPFDRSIDVRITRLRKRSKQILRNRSPIRRQPAAAKP